ncbi:S-methyl-5'-thioadenosine phosphorylase [Holothuria leucospilota]|uniref:S-methyl-5'-thioadenosine phosphorylase n=1 Tax=Holothuria leucospilota TaxID=206669 RepID=A0A9Q1BB29_HOLLE|nr:S-methyl-5'-thioadenosine phosphorylase [Holothuria leucospilota]
MASIKVGIIGGTGLDNPDILLERTEKRVITAYGEPSDSLVCGKIGNVDCVLLARHNRQHGVSPSFINYRANVLALKEEGCTHLVVTTACGSLQEHIHPGEIVILDQFIDRTYRRECSFYDGKEGHLKGVCHIAMGHPFCEPLRELLVETVKSLNISCHHKGTVVTIEGPRFSTRAESKLFKSWGADVINMTTVPEVVLANEMGLPYAAIAMPTDYDSWKEDEDHVDVELVRKTLKKNSENAMKILKAFIPKLATTDWQPILNSWKERAEKAVFA